MRRAGGRGSRATLIGRCPVKTFPRRNGLNPPLFFQRASIPPSTCLLQAARARRFAPREVASPAAVASFRRRRGENLHNIYITANRCCCRCCCCQGASPEKSGSSGPVSGRGGVRRADEPPHERVPERVCGGTFPVSVDVRQGRKGRSHDCARSLDVCSFFRCTFATTNCCPAPQRRPGLYLLMYDPAFCAFRSRVIAYDDVGARRLTHPANNTFQVCRTLASMPFMGERTQEQGEGGEGNSSLGNYLVLIAINTST